MGCLDWKVHDLVPWVGEAERLDSAGTLAAAYSWGLSSTAVSGEVDFLGDGSGPRARLPKDWKCQSLKVWVWTLHGTISDIFYGSSSDSVHPDSKEGGIVRLSRG